MSQLAAELKSPSIGGTTSEIKYTSESCAQQSGLAAERANSRPKLVMSAAERREVFIIDRSRVRAFRWGASEAASINRFAVISLAETG